MQVRVRLRLCLPRSHLRTVLCPCVRSLPLAPRSLRLAANNVWHTAVYLCTDLNPHAARCTALTGQSNSVPLNPVLTDLTGALLPRLKHAVDCLVFNPPYVETDDDEAFQAQEDGVIERAWAGGVGGMRVTNRLLDQVEVRFPWLFRLCAELDPRD